ncbi:sulfotransferase [Guyparkeria sp. SCN-R1]|uniref:sulfotransferase family protein n=1 Tax=Guyparkeria sp. SCN-R1 TaxID=2341113 RepID=UPI001F012782|nr:sulfotransferase [Guyparkeria sp. SCN-R1]
MKPTKVIIIGAPRSGTNMLRDVLADLEGVATWPCDEINYIWRHSNVREPTDEFPADLAAPRAADYIRKQFDWVSRRYGAHTVVEKTCANSLRVPFVDAVVPEAKYIFIYRDGLDVVGSAVKRWKAELDIPYLARKARFVPLSDLPFYASRYLWNRVYRVISREERLAFWGPQFKGLDEALANHSLPEVCALQWQRCVELSEAAFSRMPEGKVARVSYEAFVNKPETELRRIADELGLTFGPDALGDAVKGVSPRSVGKGRDALDEDTAAAITSLVGDTLQRYGYA